MFARRGVAASLLVCLLGISIPFSNAQTCSSTQKCTSGCCNGKTGNCGFGPDYCGSDVCISTCDAQAECGPYAPSNQTTCPLNVCCSQYGFCGTTEEFCGTGCINGCEAVTRPSCNGGASSAGRYVGYYESWSPTLACDKIEPSDIDPHVWTHINYAFALPNSDGTLSTMNSYDTQLYSEMMALKQQNPNLQIWISIGGWSAGGQVFSNIAGSSSGRSTFANSIANWLKTYGFDGVDIDWEYPAAGDRGGVPADTQNFNTLLSEIRSALGTGYGLSITIPSSYWYMQGFDVVGLEKYVDWFNFMSYDIHGVWDGDNPYTARVVNPHTNLTEIANGLDLLWRNNIDGSKVQLGLGFYGRSFTLSNSACTVPGCPFDGTGDGTGGGTAGPCTGNSGTLSDYEMQVIMNTDNPVVQYNAEAAINYMSWDSNQWVSFDDEQTLYQKAQFANNLCMSGLFAWALDLGGPGTLQNPNNMDPDGTNLNGASAEGPGGNSSGIVFINPSIWNEPNPTISCYPPCTFVLPPYPTQTTITPQVWSTSLEVGYTTTVTTTISGATTTTVVYTRVTETTLITLPPVTTTAIPVWNYNVSDPHATTGTIDVTSSINLPTVVITDNPNPLTTTPAPASHPLGTRTITPPPEPHSSSTNGPFPTIHWTVGPPGPLCKTGCGALCAIFCTGTCGLECPGIGPGGIDPFDDPTDPDPPEDPDCEDEMEYPHCTVYVRSFIPESQTTYSTTSSTACETFTACDGKGTTTTTTATTSTTFPVYTPEDINPAPTAGPGVLSSIASNLASMEASWDSIYGYSAMTSVQTSNCQTCTLDAGTTVTCGLQNGCVPGSSTSVPPPPKTSTPPAPSVTSTNNKGSGLCLSIGESGKVDGKNMCQVAYMRYVPDFVYTQYTSYTFTTENAFNIALGIFGDTIAGGLFSGLVGLEGCTAIFKCDSDADYAVGMTGQQIIDGFNTLYADDHVKVCGSMYFNNGCHITVNGCNDCRDVNALCSDAAHNC